MEQSENKITDTKENLKLFVKNNLSKIISILIVFIVIIVSFFVWKDNQDKKISKLEFFSAMVKMKLPQIIIKKLF